MWMLGPNEVMAVTGIITVVGAYGEYLRALKGRKIDLALRTTREWEECIDEYTMPALQLVMGHTNTEGVDAVLRALYKGLPLRLDPARSTELSAAANWATAEGIIPASHVLRLRLSLVSFRQACMK